MYSIYINKQCLNFIQYIHNIILVKRQAKSCDPNKEIAVLNINTISIVRSINCFIILYFLF